MNEKSILSKIFAKHYNWYIIASFSILIFEIFFLIMGLIRFDLTKWTHMLYFISYIFLLVCSGIMLIILLSNQKNKENYNLYLLTTYGYGSAIIIWSVIISYLDWSAGNSPIVFLTVIMGIGAIVPLKPRRFVIISVAATLALTISVCFAYIDNISVVLGTFLNITVFELTSIFIAYKTYAYGLEEFRIIEVLENLSVTDQLTSLGNRRALDQKLNTVEEYPYTIVIIDVDHFKDINDQFGHDYGDEVLIKISNILTSYFGKTVYRYGGDEMVIVSRHNSNEVYETFTEIQKEITTKLDNITISFGIYLKAEKDTPRETLMFADKALYKAKNAGRNCGFIYQED